MNFLSRNDCRPLLLCTMALAVLLAAGSSVSADPAPATGVSPATRPISHIAPSQFSRWIADLANDDPDIRDRAAQSLMSLQREDLSGLRDAVLAQKDLLPAQINSLHDIVTQVFLATEQYPPAPNAFLGLHWDSPLYDANSGDIGLIVPQRIPGFVAYRLLQPGDTILRITEQPAVDIHLRDVFMGIIAGFRPGQVIHFQILRGGQAIMVPIKLDARPAELGPAADFESWEAAREKKARDYWQNAFAAIDPDPQPAPTTHPAIPE